MSFFRFYTFILSFFLKSQKAEKKTAPTVRRTLPLQTTTAATFANLYTLLLNKQKINKRKEKETKTKNQRIKTKNNENICI